MTPKFRPRYFHLLLAAALLTGVSSKGLSSTLYWQQSYNSSPVFANWNESESQNWRDESFTNTHPTYKNGDDVIFLQDSYVAVDQFSGVSPNGITIKGNTTFSGGSIYGNLDLTVDSWSSWLYVDYQWDSTNTYLVPQRYYSTKFQSDNNFKGTVTIGDGSAVVIESTHGLGDVTNNVQVGPGASLILSNVTKSLGPILYPILINGGGISGVEGSNPNKYDTIDEFGALGNLSGNNTYAGKITLGTNSTIGSWASFFGYSGSLTLTGGVETAGYFVRFYGNDPITLSGSGITGSGGLIKDGLGNLNLNVASSYTGATTVNEGTVKATVAGAMGSTSRVTVGSLLNAKIDVVDLGLNTDLYIGPNGSAVISGSNLTLGNVINYNSSANSLQFTSSTGTITINSLQLASSGTTVSTTFASNLYLNNAVISGASALHVVGSTNVNPGGGNVNQSLNIPLVSGTGGTIVSGAVVIGEVALSSPGYLIAGGDCSIETITSGDILLNGNTAVTNLNGGDITIGYKKALTVQGGDSSDVISGFGSLAKTSTGTLTLSGANDYTGGTIIAAGKIIGDTTSVQGDIVNNAELEFDQTTDGKFISKITGSGLVTKSGAGEFEVTETGSIKAKTFNFTEGKLLNNGTISGAINLSAGTILAGSGTLAGNITVTDATVSPGNSPGVLNVSGSFTQNGGTFVAELGGTTPGSTNTSHDQLNVYSGSVILTGSPVLEVHQWLAFEPARGDVFQIIKSSGGIRGEFADFINTDYNKILIFAQHTGAVYGTGLLSTGSFVDWAGSNTQLQTIYQTVWDNAVTESASSTSSNPAAFIDGSSSDGKLAIAIITGATIDTNLFATDAAESYLGLTDYTNITTRSVMDQAMLRNSFYRQGRWSIGGDINYVTNTYKGGSSANFNRKLNSATAFVAVNYELHDTMSAGFFLGFNDGKSSTSNLDMKMKGTIFGLNAYKSFLTKNPITLKAAVTTTRLSFDSVRMLYGDATANANSQKVTGMGAELTAAVQLYKQDGLTISPMVGLVYGSSKADNFSETGSSFALSVTDLKSNSTNGILGLSVDCVATARLAFNFMAAYEKILSGGTDELSASSVGGLSPDLAITDYKSKTIYTLGAGISYRNSVRSMINFGAQMRNSSDYSNDLRLNASYIKKF